MTERAEQLGQDKRGGTPCQYSRDRTPGQDSRGSTAGTGSAGEAFYDRRKNNKGRTARKGQ
jgi:hypothetical protein